MSADAGPGDPDGQDAADADPDTEGLGREGWVLVVAVVFAVLVVPGLVYLRPAGVFRSDYRTAMLVLPMVPAVLLGIVAVWSMRIGR